MIDRGSKLATSDGTSSRNRTVSIDIGHESGIGSDSDSGNGVDPALTPSIPSPLINMDSHTFTSGHVISTELVSSDKPEWRHLAERCESDLPHDFMDMPLDEDLKRLVVPPPPPMSADYNAHVSLSPEVNSLHVMSPVEKPPTRRLPSVPCNETRVDELPARVLGRSSRECTETAMVKKCDGRHREDSAELWKKAAAVNIKERSSDAPVKCKNHPQSQLTSSVVDQTRTRTDDTHVSLVTTSGIEDAQEETFTHGDKSLTADTQFDVTSPIARSRDRRQPISDVAVARARASQGRRSLDNSDQQRVVVVKPSQRGAAVTSSCLDCDVRGRTRTTSCVVVTSAGDECVVTDGLLNGRLDWTQHEPSDHQPVVMTTSAPLAVCNDHRVNPLQCGRVNWLYLAIQV